MVSGEPGAHRKRIRHTRATDIIGQIDRAGRSTGRYRYRDGIVVHYRKGGSRGPIEVNRVNKR